MSTDESCVRVAVRIRPQLPREIIEMSRVCTTVTPGEPQITLGNDKAFTYDYVFDTDSKQNTIYDTCAKALVKGSLEGYNATILAYGQTGSGKTYTMGTGFDVDVNSELVGIIPRAIHELFNGINQVTDEFTERGQPPPKFKVTAQFLELYNDEIMDLLEYSKDKKNIKICGDSNRSVYLTGVKSEKVSSPDEALKWLKEGALARTTASTCMNAQSSRSHAIFTLHILQQRVVSAETGENEGVENDMETLSAKFHFVDLAGSERLKRTGATGDRAKEGISINCGLLALGNVISALGDQSKRALHVPYRDSKLTRLLQDSLGGNSRTLMIACVSPSDADFMETLNTLNYANRARNIQNKVVINQDKTSRTIAMLKKQIQELQLELMEYKQGKRVIGDDGVEAVNDMFHENTLLQTELDNLRTRVKALQQTVDSLNVRNIELLSDKAITCINQDGDNKNDDMSQLIKGYLTEIENLRAKLVESESVCSELRKTVSRNRAIAHPTIDTDESIESVIDLANKEIKREVSLIATKKKSLDQSDDSEGDSSSESEGDGDDSEENGKNEYSAELAALTSEISIKQQLIEALEKSQKKLHNMKLHYEEKLVLLQEKIQATVKERDSVLAAYCKENNQPTEKIKKVKEDYEKRLSSMQRELKSLQTAKKEHARLLRNQSQNESHIRVLSNEVAEMKRTKVKLMNKMKEETQRHKEAENRRNREIAQLKKQSRIDANTIKKMEEEKRAKMIVLKRKQEEVAALRLAANRKSSHKKSSGRSGGGLNEAKRKWVVLEKRIAEITLNNQSISALEKEMVKKMERRGELLEELKQKKAAAKDLSSKDSTVLKEEVENLEANLDHIQSAVSDLQNEILQVSENKESYGTDILNTVTNPTEFPYIIEKLYNMALHQSCLAAQSECSFKELAVENEQLKKDSEMQEQLLRHLVENQNKDTRLASPNCESSPEPSPRSASPLDNGNESLIPKRIFGKQRKKMMAPQDLLFQNDNPQSSTVGMNMSYHGGQSLSAATSPEHHRPASDNNHAPFPLTRSLTTIKEKGLDASPPGSPQPYRRQTSREENVFSRLTSQQPHFISTSRKPGKITPCPPKKTRQALQCSHVIEGHSRAALTLHATADNLFTGSKDRTVIVWDLNEMRESQVFGQYKDSVVDVKYNHALQSLFTVYSCFIEMRDLRGPKPIQILSVDGVAFPPSSQLYNFERTASPVNAIAINDDGTYLYSAIHRVLAWDLRTLKTVTTLAGHRSKVKCVAVTSHPDNTDDTVVTGGKDHYIKVFDMGGQLNGLHLPRATLDPPHYDGIECLAIQNQTLFSGSRDCHIKKWKLDSSEHITSINLAHRDWVTDLCFSPDGSMLVSGSRDGYLKLWSVDTCANLAQVQTNCFSVNAVVSNSSHIFSASSEGNCHVWRISSQLAV